MRDVIAVGIDIGGSAIKAMVAKRDSNTSRLLMLGGGEVQSEGVRKGDVVDHEAAVKQLKQVIERSEKTSGIRISSAVFSYGGSTLDSFTAHGSIVLPYSSGGEITERDISRVLEASFTSVLPLLNKTVLHRVPLFFRVDRDVVTRNPLGLSGSRLEVETLFVTALSPSIEQIARSAERAGIAVEDVVASPLAVARTVLTRRQKEVGVMALDIGAGTIGIALFEEGIPRSVAIFPLGAQAVTHDIAIGLRIGLDEAESYKRGYKTYRGVQKKQLEEIVAARMSDIFELVKRHLKKIGRDGLLPAGVVLAGGGAKLTDAVFLGKESLRLPVTIAEKTEETGIQEKFDASFACVTGLCLLAFDRRDEHSSFFSGLDAKHSSFLWRWIKMFLP